MKSMLISPILLLLLPGLKGQEPRPGQVEEVGHRWLTGQPVVLVKTRDQHQSTGQDYDQRIGQLYHISSDTLYLYPSKGLPLGDGLMEKLERIPLAEADQVLLQKGGNRLLKAKRSELLFFDGGPDQMKYERKARGSAIYSDFLIEASSMEEAFPYSRVLRQVFPDKYFRISLSLGIGKDPAQAEAGSALRSSALPRPDYSYGSSGTSVDLLDLSFRMRDRFILGSQILGRRSSFNWYGDAGDMNFSSFYNYDLEFRQYSIYAEYVFHHLDRYFTHPWEWTLGTGLLFGHPRWFIYQSADWLESPENWEFEEISYKRDEMIYGLQLRGAFHYYFFPGLSLLSGLEWNLYRPWTIEALEMVSPHEEPAPLLPEHSLRFSCLRFKIGLSIYL